MSGVPYVFGNATTSIPLSQLDVNFSTTATLGNASVGLGNTTTTVGNLTVSNVIINGLSGGGANGVVYINSSNVATANASVLALDGNGNLGLGVTPSAWGSGSHAMQIIRGGFWHDGSAYFSMNSNAYYNGSNWIYINSSSAYASNYAQVNGAHEWFTAPTGTSGNTVSFTQAMTLTNSGYLQVGNYGSFPSNHVLYNPNATAAGNTIVTFASYNGGYGQYHQFFYADTASWNSANAAYKIGSVNATSRSINASGSVNINGLDYAEYMIKGGNFTINKGDICGIDANGKLTNVFATAISFVVKSTNPGLVGGDTWGTDTALGLTQPVKPTEPKRAENESDADWATSEANYQTALATYNTELETFNTALETARQMVDRIAFSGQVPVNVTGATAGQYIVPVANQDGSIGGQAVSESAMTLQQYMQSVGKVISVVGNVTTIIVKVA